jgi:hypothetical protein
VTSANSARDSELQYESLKIIINANPAIGYNTVPKLKSGFCGWAVLKRLLQTAMFKFGFIQADGQTD